jgi:hypothetical protein
VACRARLGRADDSPPAGIGVTGVFALSSISAQHEIFPRNIAKATSASTTS